jgi:hypothetical protein
MAIGIQIVAKGQDAGKPKTHLSSRSSSSSSRTGEAGAVLSLTRVPARLILLCLAVCHHSLLGVDGPKSEPVCMTPLLVLAFLSG